MPDPAGHKGRSKIRDGLRADAREGTQMNTPRTGTCQRCHEHPAHHTCELCDAPLCDGCNFGTAKDPLCALCDATVKQVMERDFLMGKSNG